MSDQRMDFEPELVERLTDIAPRPRPDALERMRLAVAHTPQRRGWHVALTGALLGVDWTRMGATAAVAAVALATGIAIGRSGLPAGDDASTPPNPSPCVEPSAAASSSPEDLVWNSERATQDWPGPLRAEPPGCAPVIIPISGPDENRRYTFNDPRGDVAPDIAVVDIGEVVLQSGCWYRPSACVFFDVAARPWPMPDPRDEWLAYGVVVDTTGDGRPDARYGVDNAYGIDDASVAAEFGRMWRIDLATGSMYAPIQILENPRIMDAVFPDSEDSNPRGPGHIWVHLGPPWSDEDVVRVYVWAAAIVDGQIVATDYAPDVGWIEMPPQSDE
jgi:hypothetical protein